MSVGRIKIPQCIAQLAETVIASSPHRAILLQEEDRTVNGTFARVASARNSRTVAFGYVFTPSRGLTRLVHGRKREERAGSCGEFCHQRKPLPHRLQCGSVIKRREGMAPALSGDECRAWAGHPVMIARTHHHHGMNYAVTVIRLFKNGNEWKESTRFHRDDLLTVAKVMDLAHTWIIRKQQNEI